MKVTVNSITGFEDAFVAMYISKRTWTPELDKEIRNTCNNVIDEYGHLKEKCTEENLKKFNGWLSTLLKMGRKHITVLRFIDISSSENVANLVLLLIILLSNLLA